MAGPSSQNGRATNPLDPHVSSPGTPRAYGSFLQIHQAAQANDRYLRLQIALGVPPAPIPVLHATAPTHAKQAAGVSSTVGHLTGDRRFESVSLHRRVSCEPDFRGAGQGPRLPE